MLLIILAAAGMCNIIVAGYIFQPIRNLLSKCLPQGVYYLFTCPACTGFWCGFVCGWIGTHQFGDALFLYACAGSLASAVSAIFMNCLADLSGYLTGAPAEPLPPADAGAESAPSASPEPPENLGSAQTESSPPQP